MNGTPHNTSSRFVVSNDFLPKAVGDCIPDERMKEIVRRLVSIVPDNLEADVVRSESPPNDKTKLWYKESTKKLYAFNPDSSSWEETNVDRYSVCINPESDEALSKDESGCLLLDLSNKPGVAEYFDGDITSDGSGNATKTVTLVNFEDDKATVTVMPLEDFGVSARWWISDQTATSVTVSFAGLTVSTTFSVRITVTKQVLA